MYEKVHQKIILWQKRWKTFFYRRKIFQSSRETFMYASSLDLQKLLSGRNSCELFLVGKLLFIDHIAQISKTIIFYFEAIFFDYNTPHRTNSNTTDKPRAAIAYHYLNMVIFPKYFQKFFLLLVCFHALSLWNDIGDIPESMQQIIILFL